MCNLLLLIQDWRILILVENKKYSSISFFQMCHLDQNDVRISGIKVIVDILMFHGSSAFANDEDDQDQRNESDEDLFEEEDDDLQVETSFNFIKA
jgi:hypothetical protein